MEVPLRRVVARTLGGILAPERRVKGVSLSAALVRETSRSAKSVDELSHLPQPLEVEEVGGDDGRKTCPGVRGGVGRAERHGGMATVGQTDDDVGILAVADTDDGQLLSTEGVMRMRDRHESRRESGRRGSALGMCRSQGDVACRPAWG
jgi:hypothetical protein